MHTIPPNYDNKVYAGWLGKCIGVRFGAPVENWTYQEIRDTLGALEDYLPLPAGKIFKPDDDTALPMILIRALQDYGPEVTAAQLGESWLNYLGDQRGTLWWGGYGISSEHTAYLNLAAGIPAPLSGSAALNGSALAEQIGGQIFSDIWGLVAPGNPELAAAYAARASSVSHDGNAIYGGMFIAALVSQAFVEANPERLIQTALRVIPADCEYARVVTNMLTYHGQNPGDWHQAYDFLATTFGYDRYPGPVHVIPNAGAVVMALLYGEGDFSRAIRIANMAGWDTDCNAGNVGAIMGVAVGLEGIPARWREPMNDVLVAASVIGTRNLLDIPACADLFSALGRQVAGEPARPGKPRYHFGYPGATHGFQARSDGGSVVALRQVGGEGGDGALRAIVRKLSKKGEARLFTRTYYRPAELSANYYGASFSPKLYPGQRLRARLALPGDAPEQLLASLYVWDDNRRQSHQGAGQPLLPGRSHDLSFEVPELRGVCFSEVGVVLRNLGEPWSGSVLLESLDWDGQPRYSYDFASERGEYGGVSQWTVLRGYWRLDDGAYHGSGSGLNESYSGDVEWRDYTLTAELIPLVGEHHTILVRVQGALRSYAAGLAPDGQLTLYKNERGYRPLASAGVAWRHGQRYEVSVAVAGGHIEVRLNGEPRLEWTDGERPYLHGQIGVSNGPGCHTRYTEVRVE